MGYYKMSKCRTSRFATVWTVLNVKRALTPFDLIACHVVTATRLTRELFVLCAVNKQPTMQNEHMTRVPTVTRRKLYLARHAESCFLSSFTIPKKYLPVRKFTLEAELQLYSFCNLGVRRGGGCVFKATPRPIYPRQ